MRAIRRTEVIAFIVGLVMVMSPIPPAAEMVASNAPTIRHYSFGDAQPGLPQSTSSAPQEFEIADAYAKAEARRFGGETVVARMLQRVTSTTRSSDGARYTANRWGGWVADVSTTPYWMLGAFGSFRAETAPPAYTLASWVGVGGYTGSTIAQAGFDEGKQQAWYELYPNSPVYIAIYPSAGDYLYVDVHLDLSTYHWYILFEDESTGQYWSSEFAFNTDQNSAEWVMELASGTSIPRSSSVPFSSSQWEDENGYLQNVNSSEAVPRQLTLSPGCGSISPSGLTGGQAFTDFVHPC